MKLLLDEMYPATLADALTAEGIASSTAKQLGLVGSADSDLLDSAAREGHVLLTENVSDFARLSGELLTAGGHHSGILIALSSRFTRRTAGISAIVGAVKHLNGDDLSDRLIYLERPQNV